MGGMESRQGIRTARLPEFLQQQTVSDMCPGDERWAQLGAMLVLPSGESYLHPDWKVYQEPSEQHPLVIQRTEEGYIVDTTLIGDDGWFFNDDLESLETDGKQPLPILRVIFDIPQQR